LTARRRLVLSAALVLSTTCLAAAAPAGVPTDFAFRLEFGCGPTDVIDMFTGEFIRDVGLAGQHTVKALVRLSPAQKATVFEEMSKIRVFDYPERFRPPVAAFTEPSNHYQLRVRSGGRNHTIAWDDSLGAEYRAKTPEAVRLRELLTTIIETFLAMPEVKRLPRVQVFCL
jgi:hypothetical protein